MATKCYGDKIRAKHKLRPSELEQPKLVESYHSQTDSQERYERVKSTAPNGFHELLQKVIRAVILGRPVHIYRFIADMLEVELAQRTFDDIMYGCMLKKSKKLEPYPSESCKLLNSFVHQTKLEIYGEDQFMMGAIPEYDLEKPALDRYRDYAGIGVFDMTCCELPPEPEPIQTAELEEPPKCEAPAEEPVQAARKEAVFDKGPIPDYEMQEPALDRYRDYAGIEPFELLEDKCEDHEPLCRCTFCSMKDGRSQPTSAIDDVKKPCKRIAPDVDPLKIFVDSPVYRQTKVRDEDAYKEGDLDAVKPFGEVFQQEKQFEEDVFEPEYPFGEKTFTQQHPLFGDFGVKCDRGRVVDPREQQLVESPEYETPEALNDPADGEEDPERMFESPEFDNPEALDDPEEDQQTFGGQGFETAEGELHEKMEAAEELEQAQNETKEVLETEPENAEATEANPEENKTEEALETEPENAEATEANPEETAA